MQVMCTPLIYFLLWGISVLCHRHDGRMRTNATPAKYISASEINWERQRNRASNTDEIGLVKEDATGVHTWNSAMTAAGNNNATSFKIKSSTEKRRYQYERSLNVHETENVNFGSIKRRDSRRHQMENFHFEKVAAMETPGGNYMSSRFQFMKHLVGDMRNYRRKRGTINSQKTSVREKSLKSPELEAFLETPQTMWEPVPRPLALNLSTDFPFDVTEDYYSPDDNLREPTPLFPINTRAKTSRLRNPFYPLTGESYGAYAIVCMSIIIFVVGILGNIVIMCIVCHNYYMRSISNSLLANLALWDFLIVFFCLPLVVFHELTKTWLLGEFSCKIIPYIEVTSLGVATFTLCALCIDRFRAATNVQMYYEMMESCGSTSAKLAVIWVGALLLAVPELLLRQMVKEEEPGVESEAEPGAWPRESCVVRISTDLPDTIYVLGLTYDGARLWWYFGCYFCLPTLFTIGSSLATARKIQRAERACARGNKKQIRLESQMNCTVVALAILYGLCVVPENICNIVSAYMAAGVAPRSMELLQLVSQMLLFCRSAATPVLLLALCRPFGRAFLDCCCCCCAECGPARSSAAASEDNDRECTTELELSPFSTMRRDTSGHTPAGTHC